MTTPDPDAAHAASQWRLVPAIFRNIGMLQMPDMPPMFRPAHQPARSEERRIYDRRRDDDVQQRRWYKTARWQRLKAEVHARDMFRCRATGVLCVGRHPAPNSAVADHIAEPMGDEALFWDIDNVRTVSKEYHDGERQREQARARGFNPYSIPRGVLKSGIPVTLVCGPPGSGRSEWVRAQAQPGDIVIDFDDIRQRLGFGRHDSGRAALAATFGERDRMIRSLARKARGRAWLVVLAPTAAERRAWIAALGDVTVVEMAADAVACVARIEAAGALDGGAPRLIDAVRDWFARRGG